jgi:hypothetical protein
MLQGWDMDRTSPRSRAAEAAFGAPPPGPRIAGIGHNDGPPLYGRGHLILWQKASKAAWNSVPPEVIRRRLALAAETGLTYREYTLEILERGRWLMPDRDTDRIEAIKSGRG